MIVFRSSKTLSKSMGPGGARRATWAQGSPEGQRGPGGSGAIRPSVRLCRWFLLLVAREVDVGFCCLHWFGSNPISTNSRSTAIGRPLLVLIPNISCSNTRYSSSKLRNVGFEVLGLLTDRIEELDLHWMSGHGSCQKETPIRNSSECTTRRFRFYF